MGVVAAALVLGLAWAPGASAFEWLGQYGIGAPSNGPGGILSLGGVAVAPDGTVVVSDRAEQRVSVFAPSGRFLRAFGMNVSTAVGTGFEVCTDDCQTGSPGSGAGEMMEPRGLAAGPDEIYVADNANYRVDVYDYQGHFLRAFGKEVGGPGADVCTVSCVAGKGAGGEAAQLAAPSAVALGPAGEIFVTEQAGGRVSVFEAKTGRFLRAFGKEVGGPGVNTCTTTCHQGISDNSAGALDVPWGIAMGPEGNLFISEISADRVSVFSREGQFLHSFGTTGSGSGELSSPEGVAVTPDGDVYVGDGGNFRVSVFGVGGDFRKAMGWDVVPGEPVAAETCTAPCKMGLPESGVGSFPSVAAIAADCRGAVYLGVSSLSVRVEKYGEPGTQPPPCIAKPSNAFSFGKSRSNRKKGTLTAVVNVPGAGLLSLSTGRSLSATSPQPAGSGAVLVTVKAAGKGIKALARSGTLKGTLSVTFTPPNGDPNTQSEPLQLSKKVKKHRKAGKHKGGKHRH